MFHFHYNVVSYIAALLCEALWESSNLTRTLLEKQNVVPVYIICLSEIVASLTVQVLRSAGS